MVTLRDADGHSVSDQSVKTQEHRRSAWLLGPTKSYIEKCHETKMIDILIKTKFRHPFCILIILFFESRCC